MATITVVSDYDAKNDMRKVLAREGLEEIEHTELPQDRGDSVYSPAPDCPCRSHHRYQATYTATMGTSTDDVKAHWGILAGMGPHDTEWAITTTTNISCSSKLARKLRPVLKPFRSSNRSQRA